MKAQISADWLIELTVIALFWSFVGLLLLQVFEVIGISWWWVFSPLIAIGVLFVLLWVGLGIYVLVTSKK